MSTVTLRRCLSYEKAKDAVARSIEDLGGIDVFVSPGDSVLLKPNMLGAYDPTRAVTTHPSVVQAVAELVLDCRGKPFISDSPGLDPFHFTASKTGIGQIGSRLGIPVSPLTESIPAPIGKGSPFRRIEISRQALEADRIINIPKLKTHCQMTLTMGVKNLFGTVVSQRKAEWHYKVGLNRDRFARLLLEIWACLRPGLTVLDGIIGMEGRGPSNGRPRNFGLIAASDDALSMDMVLAPMMGVPLEKYPLYRAAAEAGMAPNPSSVVGDLPPNPFSPIVDLPNSDSIRLLPSWMDRLGREVLASRPVQDKGKCIRCGKCSRICPADALKLDSLGNLNFDYNRCIRCYCCHEMCPADAIDLKKGVILRILEGLNR